MTKHRLIAAAACCLAVAAGPLGAQQGYSNDAIDIGVITDLRGIYSDWGGQGIVTAAEMAAEDMGGEVNGREIRIHVRDDQLNGDRAVRLAEELRNDHQVDMVTGPTGSNVAIPLQKWAREHGIVSITAGAASTALTGEECSRTGVHWTYDTYALANVSTQAIIDEDADEWYFITADYVFGHILQRQTAAAVKRFGGKVLGNSMAKYKGQSFFDELRAAQQSGAEVIGLANAGKDTQRTIRQGYELGLMRGETSMVALLVFLTDIRHLGMYVTQGLRFTTGFYWNRDEQTRAWSKRFKDRHGAMPTMAQAGTYSAVRHYLQSAEAADTDDGRTVTDTMKERPVKDFFAPNGKVRADGRMVHEMYLVQVRAPSESRNSWDYLNILQTVPGEKAFRPLEQSPCAYL